MTNASSKKSLERRVRALEARVEMLESLLRALVQAAPRHDPGHPVPFSPDYGRHTHFYEPPCPCREPWRPRGIERILGPSIT